MTLFRPTTYNTITPRGGFLFDRGPNHRPRYHQGVDTATPQGTPIYGSGVGTVVEVGNTGNRSGHGRYARISYPIPGKGNLVVTTSHMSARYVERGDRVTASSRIGLTGGAVGSSGAGASTGPHIHIEARLNGVLVNPYSILLPRQDMSGGGSIPKPNRKKRSGMTTMLGYIANGGPKGQHLFYLFEPGRHGLPFTGQTAANGFSAQVGANAAPISQSFINLNERIAGGPIKIEVTNLEVENELPDNPLGAVVE